MVASERKQNESNLVRRSIIAALISFCTSSLAVWLIFTEANNSIKAQVQDHILGIAKIASVLSIVDLQKNITKPQDYGDIAYRTAQEPYVKMLKVLPDLKYIYTMILKDDKVYFIVDSQRPEDTDPPSGVMENYPPVTPKLLEALRNKSPEVEDTVSSDKWGTELSAYAPIYDSNNEFFGIVGVDMLVDKYLQKFQKISKFFYLIISFCAVSSLFVGFLVHRAGRLYNSIHEEE